MKLILDKSFFLLIFFCLSVTLHEVDSEDITLYDYPDYDGSSFTLTISGTVCYNFSPRWEKRASSAEIKDGCFLAWDRLDCRGNKVKLTRGMEGARDLKRVKFDKAISSVSLCSSMDSERGGESPRQGERDRPRQESNTSLSLKDVQELAVQEHNKYRKKHGVPDLQGDAGMHEEAQRFADYLARTNKFETSRIGRYGENVATSYRKNKAEAVRDAVQRWYSKIKDYDFNRPGYNVDGYNTGSFTAIVWRATTRLGFGISWNEREEEWMIVAYYSPPARRNQFRENVPPPVS